LPNLLLLIVVLAVLRGGWRAMTVGFARMSVDAQEPGALRPHQVLPVRMLARVALVVGGLMVLPLVLGSEGGVFSDVGLLLLLVVGLAAVPLLANVAVGLYAMFTNLYAAGEWLSVKRGSMEVAGEVTRVDFFHLRLVPELGGEIRLPHLLALWSAVDHLPRSSALTVEFAVPRDAFTAREGLQRLQKAAADVAAALRLTGTPTVVLRDLSPDAARFRIALPEGPEMARTQLLLALEDATRRSLP
jgi:small-conductance mechanosensitive channel